jgi:hypothetical protein
VFLVASSLHSPREWLIVSLPDLDDDTSEADESAAIEAGAINATGFRYVGTLPPE